MRIPTQRTVMLLAVTLAMTGVALTPTAFPETVTLQDDFEDSVATESTWIQGLLDAQDAGWTVTSGAFRAASDQPIFAAIGKDGPCAFQDGDFQGHTYYANTIFSMSFDMRYVSDPNDAVAGGYLLALIPDDNPDQPLVFFDFVPNLNLLNLGVLPERTPGTEITIDQLTLPGTFDRFQWHHYDVSLVDNIVSFTVDSTHTVSGPVPTSLPAGGFWRTMGGAGLFVGAFFPNPGTVVEFDNYSLTAEPVCPCDIPDLQESDITSDAHHTRSVKLADMNGDGHLDLVVGNEFTTNRIYLNNGTSDPFLGVVGSDITSDAFHTHGIDVGDVNGDGHLDLVATRYLGSPHRLYLNNGTANPFDGVTGITFASDSGSSSAIVLGDFNNDGLLDVVLGTYNPTSLNKIYINNGTSNPYQGVSGFPVGSDSNDTLVLVTLDFNSDGNLDLIAGNSAHFGQSNYIYFGNGTNNPFSASGFPIGFGTSGLQSIVLGDADGDGAVDLILAKEDGIWLFGSSSFGLITSNSGIDHGSGKNVALSLGDVNGDGNVDLVVGYNDGTNINKLYCNNGTLSPFQAVIPVTIEAGPSDTYGVALGDVDGNGTLDIVTGNYLQTNRLYESLSTVDLLIKLCENVIDLNLLQGLNNSLDAKIDAAIRALDDLIANNNVTAVNALEAFISTVEAQSGNSIPEADANELIAAALEIIGLLSAP